MYLSSITQLKYVKEVFGAKFKILILFHLPFDVDQNILEFAFIVFKI